MNPQKIAVKKTYVFAVAAIALLSVCIAFASVHFSSDAAEYILHLAQPPQSKYFVGEELSVSDGVFTGAKDIAADYKLIYPDGSAEKVTKKTLTMAGNYTLSYFAQADGQWLEHNYTFTVCEKKYSVSQSAASVEYHDKQVFQVDANGATEEAAGLWVTLTDGAVFTYNKIFDLTGKTREDLLIDPIIVASKDREADFYRLTVRFTDAYDPDNYVDVLIEHEGNEKDKEADYALDGTNYARAGASGQSTVGCVYGEYDRMHTNRFGAWCWTSFMNRNDNRLESSFDVYMDYAERKVYGPTRNVNNNNLIADLDEPQLFSALWEGFTTGEVYVSLFASNFKKTEGAVFIRHIFEDDASDFADAYAVDTRAPVISVDLGGYDESNLPRAVVGQSYALFPYDVFDLESVIKSRSVKVYYNYHTAFPVAVSVQDGAFVPLYSGAYTVVYSATDGFGNPGKCFLEIATQDAGEAFALTCDALRHTTGYTGESIAMADYCVVNGSGNAKVTITAASDRATYEINETERRFRPLQSGIYRVTYTATDYLGRTATDGYDVTVTDRAKPVFTDEAQLPVRLIAGYEQRLPELYAYDFINGGNAVPAKIFVKEGENGTEKALDGNVYVPSVQNAPYTATIIYRATGAQGTEEAEYTVPCYSVFKDGVAGNIDKSALFLFGSAVASSFETLSQGDATNYASYAFGEDADLTFINRLPANAFSVNIVTHKGGGTFGKLHIELTDSLDPSVKVLCTLFNTADGVYVSVNNGTRYPAPTVTFDDITAEDGSVHDNYTVNVSFDNLMRVMYVDNETYAFNVTADMQRRPFAGFASGAVYMRIVLEEVKTSAKIAVTRVCNQNLTSSVRDNGDPIFVTERDYATGYGVGEICTVYAANCLDVIDPDMTITGVMKAPDGSIVTAQDGTRMENFDVRKRYNVQLAQYGRYVLSYTVDGMYTYDYVFVVLDKEPPVVTCDIAYKQTYTVGESIALKASATDNFSQDVTVHASVLQPNGRLMYVTDGTFTFTQAGKYTLSYFAFDERDNYGCLQFTFTVEEK